MNNRSEGLPLYVDLDGTLIASDMLHESVLGLVRTAPIALLQLPAWWLGGKAFLKQEIAKRVTLDVTTLPYRPEVLELLTAARAEGRRTVLATASDQKFAQQVAQHLGLFDSVIASDGKTNLAGRNKLLAIQADSNGNPFSYVGDGVVDLEIWRAAEETVVVGRSASLARRAAEVSTVAREVRTPEVGFRRYLYGIRLHQWLKNLLVFVPLLPVLHTLGLGLLVNATTAFCAFGLMASGVYVLNDLLDLESDRKHHRKKNRPFAAGEIPIAKGVLTAVGLFTLSVLLSAWILPKAFMFVLSIYLVLTTTYSVSLKKRPVVDVFALAGLYTVRIVAGATAMSLPLSFWILSFSLFIFLSLALAKRHVELSGPGVEQGKRLAGRGYLVADLPYVLCSGISAGQISVLLLSLYLNDKDIIYRYQHREYLWSLIPLLLFWISRIWFKAIRGELHDDPVVFAARDKMSRLVAITAATAIWLAA